MGKLQCVGSGLNDSDSKWKREIGLSWLLASWYSLNCITATIKHAEIMPELKHIDSSSDIGGYSHMGVPCIFQPLSICIPTYQ